VSRAALQARVRLRRGGFALDAELTLGAGVTGLFGPSGAGKSTLVGCLAGLVRPAEGRVVRGGEVLFDAAEGVDVPPERRRVGVVFQEMRLFPHLTVRENLLYGRRRRGGDRSVDLARVHEVLELSTLLERRPAALSGGEARRVAIGRALLAGPEVLLLDEPLAGLGPGDSERMVAMLGQLKGRYAMLLVEHDVEAVFTLADRISVLVAGRIIASGSAADIQGNADVRSAYLGERA
jgi:molybdate transport system ATP-binding protein